MTNFLKPEEILNFLKLKSNMKAGEFGCGAGGFVIPLAKKLDEGKVYALDIQPEPLSALEGKAKMAGLSNIETIQCDLEEPKGSTLPDSCLDLVIIANVLFQVENESAFLSEAKRVLKEEGKILVIDWKETAPFGPEGERVNPEEIKKIAEDLGLKLETEFSASAYHYGLIFSKK